MSKNLQISVSAIFILLLSSIMLSAEVLPVKTYTVADGLLRDEAHKIKQDSRGFLWLCTDEGVSRFDGYAFKNFTVADGLPSAEVNDLLETKNGTIYVATKKGLARLAPRGSGAAENSLFTVFAPEDSRAAEIKVLFQDSNAQIWVGTSNGLYKLIETEAGATFELIPLGEPLPHIGGAVFEPEANVIFVDSIIEDRRGTLWVATFRSGLFRLSKDGGRRRFLAPDDGFSDNKITALLEDRAGQIWMGMRGDKEGGLCVLDADALEKPVKKCYTTEDGLGGNRIRDILQTSDGQIWLAGVSGLCRFEPDAGGSVCKTYAAENGLCDDINSLLEDKDGNLWTGSPCGTKKIAGYGFTTYDETDGLDKNSINAMFENADGELFATAFPKNERVISRFDGEKFTSIKPRFPAGIDYHGWGWHQTVFQDSRGAWWIPTGYGIFRSPDRTSFENLARVRLEKLETGAKALEAFRLYEDSRGDVWMATTGKYNELFCWERARNVWHDYTAQSGISPSRVGMAFVEDRSGNLWIGASSDHGDGALIRRRPNGEFRVFTAADGAPSGWTADLFTDSRGRLWAATNENGLLRLDDTNADRLEFVRYSPPNGLTSLTTNCVTEDEFGRIYAGTWRGVDRLNPDTGQIENLSNTDGLLSGHVEAAYRDRQKNLWFMTDRGLARFQPEPARVRKPPNVLITGLRVSGEARNVSILGESEIAPLDLGSDQRQLAIDFIGLGASLGEPLKYEYRLNGADWTQTRERTVNFANLSAGNYEFEVRAATADRIDSRAAIVKFHLAAPIYFQFWFLLASALLAGALVFYVYRYRVSRLLEMERVRMRIATDLHDDIGANLTKISILSEVVHQRLGNGANEFDEAHLLENIAETSRESVSAMSDIVWAINPKKDSLADLTIRMRRYAEELLERRQINLEFNAPTSDNDLKIDANLRRSIYLIFKESLNNIVRHAAAENVRIDFKSDMGKLFLKIADDGRGFEISDESDGNGLANMRKRAAELGGNLEIISSRAKGAAVILDLNLK